MGSGIKVSVVIPIYNSSQFLRECLDSLHDQTMREIEFICVNDGSKDNSLDIINEYVAKDARFKVLNKENSGYGISMNMGFEMATGEYLGIVESDDFVEPDMFEVLYQTASSLKLDVIKSNYFRFTTNPDGSHNEVFISNTTNVNRVICPADYPKILMNTTANWTGLYSKAFLEKYSIKHNETPGASYQDLGFHFLTLSLADRAYFMERAFYHYRYDNPNSSINNKSKMYCACEEYQYILHYYSKNPEVGKYFEGVLWARFHNTCLNTYARVSSDLKVEFLKYYCKTFRNALAEGKLQYDAFSPKRWREMINIITDPEKFHKKYMRYRKRDRVKQKHPDKKIPLYYRMKWNIEDNGIRTAFGNASNEIKQSLGIKHWDRADDVWTHLAIATRHMLHHMHLNFLIKNYANVQSLKDTHKGERCFIVCTGPSLKMNDLDMISNEYSFGMNTIYLAYGKTSWRPSCYVCIDAYAQKRMAKEYSIDYSTISKGPVIINRRIKTNTEDNVYRIPVGFDNHTKKNLRKGIVRIEQDLPICAYDCFSVTNFALTAAIYMGFSTIYIIGCDCNYDGKVHFIQSKLDPNKPETNRFGDAVSLSLRGYAALKEYAEKNNVKVYNATRGGYLEVFERVDFDSIDFK